MDIKSWLKVNSTAPKLLVADSCACGLGVLGELLRFINLPPAIFLADGQRNPFGLKSQGEVRNIVGDWLKYFAKEPYSIRCLVVACNTASIAVRGNFQKEVEQKFKVSIIGMVESAVEALVQATQQRRVEKIAVLGTKITIESGVYQTLITEQVKNVEVSGITCTGMECVVARGDVGTERAMLVVKKELTPLIGKYDCILLGCSCFSFLDQEIAEVLGKEGDKPILVDPARFVAFDVAKRVLGESALKLRRSKSFSANEPLILTTEGSEWLANVKSVADLLFPNKLEVSFVKIRSS